MRKLKSAAIILFVLLSALAYDRPVRAQTQKEPGAITGRVKLEGKPVKGITITAAPELSPDRIVEAMFNSSASMKAVTDSEGVYRLEGIPAGKYRVAPSAPALVSADANSSTEITVSEGATAENVDFALSLGGVITGKITDSEGQPVIGERVSLKQMDASRPATGPSIVGMFGNRMYATDDRGVYRIFGLQPGRYVVSAGKDSDAMSNIFSQRAKRVQTFYPGVTEESKAKPIVVTAASEAAGVDIQFSGADKGFVISGRVLDSESKAPIANAMVAYSKAIKDSTADDLRITTDTGNDLTGMPGGFTTTNDKGEFRFAFVLPGNYKMEATSIGAFAGSGGSQFYADPVLFEVESTNVEKLEIKVHRGAGISGVVVIESADPQDSLDRYGQLMLMAMVIDPSSKSFSSGNCIVGPDGTFRLGGLKPGKVTFRTFSMSARKPGILRLERNGVEVQGGIEVQPNEEVLGLRLILAPSNGVIRGRVTIQGGSLPKGAEVVALARPVNNDQPDIGDTYRRVDVSSTGAFLIENLTPGTYEVQVTSSVPRQSGSRSVSSKQTVTVTGSSPVEVDIVLDLSGKGSDK